MLEAGMVIKNKEYGTTWELKIDTDDKRYWICLDPGRTSNNWIGLTLPWQDDGWMPHPDSWEVYDDPFANWVKEVRENADREASNR